MVTDADFDELKESFDRYRKVVDTLLNNLGIQSLDLPGTIHVGGNMYLSPTGVVSRRENYQFPLEVVANQIIGGVGAVPTKAPDMDFNSDGVINILDSSVLAARFYPPRGAGWMWVQTPTDSPRAGSSPIPQSYVTGLTFAASDAYMSESTSVQMGSLSTGGHAFAKFHSSKSSAMSQADLGVSGAIWQAATTISQITADKNDFEIGQNTCTVFRISSDAARNITGIVAPLPASTPVPNAWWCILYNVGSFNITLKDNSGSSSAGNKFALDADVVIKPDQGVFLMYDSASTVWRALSFPSSTPTTLLLTDTAWAAKGDLAVGTGNDTAQILSKGTDGTRLVADATGIATYGIGWKAFWYIVASCTGSGTTALSSYHKYVRFASMTGNCTATLYSAATIGEGDCVLFKRNDTTGFNATINTTSSQTIDGALSITLAPYESALLVSNGSNWERN